MITNVPVSFFSVEPGHYMAVPSTMDSGLEKEFLLGYSHQVHYKISCI